jgi:hypothetical protein
MRQITDDEHKLLFYLIGQSGSEKQIPDKVLSMKGGTGSISFDMNGSGCRTTQLIAGTFNDQDGVLVDFELTCDQHGNLFELDMWKVDFSQLKRLPELEEIKITTYNK